MYQRIAENRAKRLKQKRRKRIILFFFAMVFVIFSSAIIQSPVLSEKFDRSISRLILLAKRGEIVPENTPTPISTREETTTPTQTVVPKTPSLTPTSTSEIIVISSTPYPIIEILTGLPEGTVFMREGASVKYPIVRVLTEGDEMTFYGCFSGWAQITINNQAGFVYSKYTNIICENKP